MEIRCNEEKRKYACVCCGELTMDEQPPGTYQICPVCGWEDDKFQFKNPDERGGANCLSLNESKEVYFSQKRGYNHEKDIEK
ncbi:MAG: hydrolase [Firmicutes bacterium]|nr:hydrolase [Bacillota bacterium]